MGLERMVQFKMTRRRRSIQSAVLGCAVSNFRLELMDPAWKGWKQKPTWRLAIERLSAFLMPRMPPFPFRNIGRAFLMLFVWHSALVRGFGSWVRLYNLRPQRLRSHEGFWTVPACLNSKGSSGDVCGSCELQGLLSTNLHLPAESVAILYTVFTWDCPFHDGFQLCIVACRKDSPYQM